MNGGGDRIPSAGGTRVLVADDDRAFGLFARYVLTKVGCAVDLAEDAGDAMSLLADAARTYHAVVVDAGLTDAQGRNVAFETASLRPDAALLCVCEGYEREDSRHDMWLRKPYQPAALVRALSAANSVSLIRRLHQSKRDRNGMIEHC